MLKRLKKLFQTKQEPTIEEVSLAELEPWFKKKISQLNYNNYFQDYFNQIKEIKTELEEKIGILKNKEVSEKDKKQVEARVQNIVTGQKEGYVREVERFQDKLEAIEKENFSTQEDFQEVLQFNQNLDQEIEELAKRTGKSYQATQHLFFNQIEPVFKLIGKLNTLINHFSKSKKKDDILRLNELKKLVDNLNEDKKRKTSLEREAEEISEKINEFKKQNEEELNKLKSLKESEEHGSYKLLKQQEKELDQKIKDLDGEIFSFFAKLEKPLRKYERVALDNKPIGPYLGNSTAAFWNDSKLKIIEVLQGLKKNLSSLDFDEKQINRFTELIEKSETNYLQELASKGKELSEKINKVKAEIENQQIISKIESTEKEIRNLIHRRETAEKDLLELNSKLEKNEASKIKEEFCLKSREIFNVELSILG